MVESVVGLLNHTKDSDPKADYSSQNSQRTESILVRQENP